MHPLQAGNIHDLAAAAYAALVAAQATDDDEQLSGLITAAEYLTAELKRIAWELVEESEFPEEDDRKSEDSKGSNDPLNKLSIDQSNEPAA
ncbi:MAG: hypothetical protein K9L82_07075 [Chromatiaceae bacterium]|nr:hypothetical protein [Chromatiaceae bacterium]MCF7996755.1 hypothetical protein [Chromatiaceae bacterium]MCF8004037.1 hypothetical protein [Chromatiaceae bacterium]